MHESALRKPLRLWPGVVAVALLMLVLLVLPRLVPDIGFFGFIGGVVAALIIVLWWLFFSRAPWAERLGAVGLMIVAVIATKPLLHESVAGAGQGMMIYFYATYGMAVALVAWALLSRRLAAGVRRATLVATILLAGGAWTLVRTGGFTGTGDSDFHWRWTPTPEERLLARAGDEPLAPPPPPATTEAAAPAVEPRAVEQSVERAQAPTAAPAAARPTEPAPPSPSSSKTDAEWPGFRGPARDGVVHGVRIATDWLRKPPVELWRRPIGPGWSSFAVRGELVYTQEQRGQDEVVSCYRLSTGEPVWRHGDPARFYESNGGAGPRGTPLVSNGRVYTLGATGILNAIDAISGAVAWSRNAAADTEVEVPGWGFAGSPLVVGDLVIIATSGRLAAYDRATGDLRWLGPTEGGGYSSPHLVTIDGVPQIVLLRGRRTTSVAPADGAVLWEHSWQPSVSIVQPALAANGELLICAGEMGGIGIRRIAVARGSNGWTTEERWTSRGLKPYFNDFVIHQGHAYGFDASILACIDLADGARKWKGGRYGHGQMLLLADQDLLLVLSEEGELALVGATPDQFREIARVPAIEGKTWNHPALAGDILLVRNAEEMAAFRLTLAAP